MFGRRKKSTADGNAVRIFFSTDLHGSDVCFKKFISGAAFYRADILIMGGDTTGKMIVPIVRQASGNYLTSYAGKDLELTLQDEVAGFEKRMANMGFYPVVMDEDEFDSVKGSEDKKKELFLELIRRRWEDWIAYAENKLVGTDIPVYAAPGNDDFLEVDEMIASSERIVLIEGKVYQLTEDHEILTTGWTNPTPWKTERELPEERLAERLAAMIEEVQDMERCIFNIHVPPHDSKLDLCPKLDEQLRPVYEMGNPVQAPAGSTAVRAAIERHQPLLGLHGHIHEGRGEVQIGKTLCLNPGSVYSEGVLNGALVTLSNGRVKDYQFTQG
jgi:Icc-related predicted phosphoesterase